MLKNTKDDFCKKNGIQENWKREIICKNIEIIYSPKPKAEQDLIESNFGLKEILKEIEIAAARFLLDINMSYDNQNHCERMHLFIKKSIL